MTLMVKRFDGKVIEYPNAERSRAVRDTGVARIKVENNGKNVVLYLDFNKELADEQDEN